MLTVELAKKHAKEMLSEERYRHTRYVAQEARLLAQRYGVDEDKAELAGWLHDIVKEYSKEQLLQLLKQDDIMCQSTTRRPLPIWHGPGAAIYAQKNLGLEDEEILEAIRCHTTGKEEMSTFEKVFFLADIICEGRSTPGVGRLRALAKKDLDQAVIAAMEKNIVYLNSKNKPLDEQTVKALSALKSKTGGEKLE